MSTSKAEFWICEISSLILSYSGSVQVVYARASKLNIAPTVLQNNFWRVTFRTEILLSVKNMENAQVLIYSSTLTAITLYIHATQNKLLLTRQKQKLVGITPNNRKIPQ